MPFLKLEDRQAYQRRYYSTANVKGWYNTLKKSARRRGKVFALTLADMPKCPEKCPVLGIVLRYGSQRGDPYSASIDRIDDTLGYVPGNVRVVSRLANLRRTRSCRSKM